MNSTNILPKFSFRSGIDLIKPYNVAFLLASPSNYIVKDSLSTTLSYLIDTGTIKILYWLY
jgi:hypothetical protein